MNGNLICMINILNVLIYNYNMKIIIHLIGNNLQGTGHVYRMLRLTDKCNSSIDELHNIYNVFFIVNKNETLAIKILEKNNADYIKYNNYNELYNILSKNNSDIIINDCLNTSEELIINQKKYTKKVINFEDYGKGVNNADIIINSFYNENVINGNKIYTGLKYTLLSPLLSKSDVSIFNIKPLKLILTFGGSDPSNIVETVLNILVTNNINNKIHILVILGIGYKNTSKILEIVNNYNNISISVDEQNMIGQFQTSDIAITSCGCAMFESCYFLLPTICIAHNDREILHTNLCPENTIINMGLFSKFNGDVLIKYLNLLIDSQEKRKYIRENMLEIHNDIKDSYKNVFDLIFKE
jgi:spore coat polysaccharide biosynthesis predicted glycosyltransferase SpsG